MSTNPYAPPKAVVADVALAGVAAEPIFFPVSRKKLIVMSTVTLTLYELVWFYNNWALCVSAARRCCRSCVTIFAVFFCYSVVRAYPCASPWPSGGRRSAGGAAGNGMDRAYTIVQPTCSTALSQREVFPVVYAASIVVLLVGLASVLVLVPVQDAINAINRAEVPDHDPNEPLHGVELALDRRRRAPACSRS